jgi:hypothetical protein
MVVNIHHGRALSLEAIEIARRRDVIITRSDLPLDAESRHRCYYYGVVDVLQGRFRLEETKGTLSVQHVYRVYQHIDVCAIGMEKAA